MTLTASVRLSGEDRLKCSFTAPAKATNLNKHGAAVQLSRDLAVGCVLLVQNQFGSQVPARVVAQLTASQGVSSYGIEFVEQDDKTRNFWGITFPSLQSSPAIAQVAEQSGIARRRRGNPSPHS